MRIVMRTLTALSLIVSVAAVQAQSSTGYYYQRMLSFQKAIDSHFYVPSAGFYKETVEVEKGKNAYSYFWPLCGLIQAANETEVATKKAGPFAQTLSIIRHYYDPAPPAPGFASYIPKFGGGDRFYDDNQWIGIACMDAWFRNKHKENLALGKEIYRYMMTGYDTVLGGGVYWQENKKVSKNTCSNGPGIVLAMQLYKATGEKPYLDTALLLYHWTNAHLKAPNGVYWDNIRVGSGRIGKAQFSYNTGTLLQSNLYLYEATKDKKYLTEAIAVADSSLAFFYASGKFRDNYWFNAVMLRGYQHLLKHHKDIRYINAFKACLDNALRNDINEMGLMGKPKPLDLVPQSGMSEILARFAEMEKTHNW